MPTNPVHVKVDKRLLTFFREEEVVVVEGVHKEVLCQDGWAGSVTENVEVGLNVRISIGIVGTEVLAREMV